MKTKSNFPKAIAVVLLLGIGIFYNSDFQFDKSVNNEIQLNESEQMAESKFQKENNKQSATKRALTIVTTVINYLASSR